MTYFSKMTFPSVVVLALSPVINVYAAESFDVASDVASVETSSSAASVNEAAAGAYKARKSGQLAQAIELFRVAVAGEPDNDTLRLDFAYALLANKQNAEALREFQKVASTRTQDAALQRQIGYLQIETQQNAAAVESFRRAVELEPNDETARLQLAYTLNALGRNDEATEQFQILSNANDAEIRGKAQTALRNLSGRMARGTTWTEIYGEGLAQSRFSNVLGTTVVRRGRVLDEKSQRSVYLAARLQLDTRSRAGSAPQIFADNVGILSVGLRQPLNRNITAYGEIGTAFRVGNRPTSRTGSDLRLGAYGSWQRDATIQNRRFSSEYFDASYYSRYSNFIAYGRAERGVRLNSSTRNALEAYGRLSSVVDSRGDFFNNLGEAAVGLRFKPRSDGPLSLGVEAVGGAYFGRERSGEANPHGNSYGDLRLYALYNFSRSRAPKASSQVPSQVSSQAASDNR